jgi:hypothetical protein
MQCLDRDQLLDAYSELVDEWRRALLHMEKAKGRHLYHERLRLCKEIQRRLVAARTALRGHREQHHC